ncbi:MAG: hypothetical protein ABJL99_25315 [Aliishimia sp.]
MSAQRQLFKQRCDELLRRWVRDPLLPVQVEAPQALGRLADIDLGVSSTTLQLGRRDERNAVQVSPIGVGGSHSASLWVKASYEGYRKAFKAFLVEDYVLPEASINLTGFDVDHLLNRKRSPGGSTYLRLEAIPSTINQAWGAVFEKPASNQGFYANQSRTRRTLSWPIAAKLAWIAPPNAGEGTAGIARVASGLAAYGLDRQDAITGLTNMFEFANTDPVS